MNDQDLFKLLIALVIQSYFLLVIAWTPINVESALELGSQLTPNLTNVSRDGGYSVLIGRQIIWLYDDTECLSHSGKQLSFVSNTAAYASELSSSVTTVQDFGIEQVGKDSKGEPENAILGFGAVGDGGWIPFENGEAEYNKDHDGNERIAIWPNTNPTPINRDIALMYAPLVYVDPTPVNASKHYIARGMTQIAVSATSNGPQAVRGQSGLVFPGTSIQFGGFATITGAPSLEDPKANDNRDLYLIGIGTHGLQLCRVAMDKSKEYEDISYFAPRNQIFSKYAPNPDLEANEDIYLPGSFSSGSLFYSPYFSTFLLVYFNHLADNTFYIRYLNLTEPLDPGSKTWPAGGKTGSGIAHEDAEALVHYRWSEQQVLFKSPPKSGGFNYAGVAHPEYFNRAYYPVSDEYYPPGQVFGEKRGEWYGESVVPERKAGGDGRNLLLSWTAQLQGGVDSGIYQPQLAIVKFGDIPKPGEEPKPRPEQPKPPIPEDYPDGYIGPARGSATKNSLSYVAEILFLWLAGLFVTRLILQL